jgi:hypothetical protein
MARPLGTDALGDSRAVGVADFNNDGLLDMAMNINAGKPVVYMNRLKQENRNWLAFKLQGEKSNRDAIGAALELKLEDKTLYRYVASGAGYASQAPLVVYFGMGERTKANGLVIRWPSGQVDTYEGDDFSQRLGVNRLVHLKEGQKHFKAAGHMPDSAGM